MPPMRVFRIAGSALMLAVAVCFVALSTNAQAPQGWPPITPEEVALKDNPLNVGEPAMILNYDVQTDSAKSTETVYKRIKIFREEGKKYADVEIPYFEKLTQVEEIRARVTSPDGKTEDFNGVIYDKEIVKTKKVRFSAKTFSLPNVAVGCILEYSYRLHWRFEIPDVFRNPGKYIVLIRDTLAYPAAEWDIQQSLSIRQGHFVLHPIKGDKTVTFTHGLPKDTVRATLPDGTVELGVKNIPAFQAEEYSPPEESLKIRADVFYILGFIGDDPKYYWTTVARHEAEVYDAFVGKRKNIQKEAERLLSPGDSDEAKLRKLYARVQQIRALTYEPEKTKKERKQESLKENKNVEDVLNRGYADGNEINLLFIALARAAGFQAYPVHVTSRNRNFFTKERLDSSQLNSLVVKVTLGSEARYFDPATLYCPYGMLPWEETDAGGILVDWTKGQIGGTPTPESKDAVIRRRAEFKLDADGNLEGDLTITYEGQEALSRRLKAIDQDETQRRKELEEAVQQSLPQGAVVKLLSSDAWTTSEAPLQAQFHLQVPNYANRAGHRLVLPFAVFHTNGQQAFTSARRINPVYFSYPAETYDEVTFVLPAGVEVESLPATQKVDHGAALYDLSIVKDNSLLRVKRSFKMTIYYLPVDRYAALRGFYEYVRTNDEQQAILRSAPVAAKN